MPNLFFNSKKVIFSIALFCVNLPLAPQLNAAPTTPNLDATYYQNLCTAPKTASSGNFIYFVGRSKDGFQIRRYSLDTATDLVVFEVSKETPERYACEILDVSPDGNYIAVEIRLSDRYKNATGSKASTPALLIIAHGEIRGMSQSWELSKDDLFSGAFSTSNIFAMTTVGESNKAKLSYIDLDGKNKWKPLMGGRSANNAWQLTPIYRSELVAWCYNVLRPRATEVDMWCIELKTRNIHLRPSVDINSVPTLVARDGIAIATGDGIWFSDVLGPWRPPRRMLTQSGLPNSLRGWSPDGKLVLYETRGNAGRELKFFYHGKEPEPDGINVLRRNGEKAVRIEGPFHSTQWLGNTLLLGWKGDGLYTINVFDGAVEKLMDISYSKITDTPSHRSKSKLGN